MSNSKYYARMEKPGSYRMDTEFWLVNKKFNISASEQHGYKPSLCVYVSRNEELPDTVPVTDEYERYKRIKEETFREYFNANFAAYQKFNIHGGEYYVQKFASGERIDFHFFSDKKRFHLRLICCQNFSESSFSFDYFSTISGRPGMRKNGKQISEKAFCDFYKRVLEFCYDGSAMREQQDQLYAHAVLLSTSDEPEECPVTNPDYYFQKARDLMIQRKEEIKQRLLDSDDAPSRRRELRAEMKGIDYCISVLDENH